MNLLVRLIAKEQEDIERITAIVDAFNEKIEMRDEAPEIFGIQIKPTFFYVLVGYCITALGAVAYKYIEGLFEDAV